ncbi:MAG: hypothetical protein RIQ56_805, partial [Candidatus Parcubacteria bacterium]
MIVHIHHWPRLLGNIGGTLTLALLFLHVLAPGTMAANWASGAKQIFVSFLIAHFMSAFGEYAIHRIVFHGKRRPFRRIAMMHLKHHAIHSKEFEALPWYWLALLYLVATPLILSGQLLFPKAPVLVGGYLAVTWSYLLFEY